MKKIPIIIMLSLFCFFTAQAPAFQKTPLKNGKDTTKIKVRKKSRKISEAGKQKTKHIIKASSKRQKDRFIDKNGDGINDSYQQHNPPEIKKPKLSPVKKRSSQKIKIRTPKPKKPKKDDKK